MSLRPLNEGIADASGSLSVEEGNAKYVQLAGAYPDPSWLTAVGAGKITGTVDLTHLPTSVISSTVSYANPSWITTLDAGKLTTGTLPDARLSFPLTTFGKSLVNATDAAAAGTVLGLTIGSNVEAWSAALDTLAGGNGLALSLDPTKLTNPATVSTVALGNLAPTLAAMTIGATNILPVADPFGNVELCIVTNATNLNTLQHRNQNAAGYSADNYVSSTGVTGFAVGEGNPGSVWPFANFSYLESYSVAGADSMPMRLQITQGASSPSGYRTGFKPRVDLLPNGDTNFYRDVALLSGGASGSLHDSGHNALVTIPGRDANTAPVLQIGTYYWTGSVWLEDAACELRFSDSAFAIVGRVISPHMATDFYSYGGTLAGGNGYNFYSGGARGSQALRFQIADDGVASSVPFQSPSINGNILTAGTGTLNLVSYSLTAGSSGTIATTANLAATAALSPSILSTTSGINGKTVANTALFTVPAGKTCVITAYVVRLTAASAITNGPTAGVGNVAGTSNIAAAQAMNGLTSIATSGSTSAFSWPIMGMTTVTPATNVIYFNLTTAASGTSQTLAVDLIGYLF